MGVPNPFDPGRITGPGVTTRFGFEGTDLCFMWRNAKGYTHSLHGDTFDNHCPEPGWNGGGWRSPVSLRTSNADLLRGIRWDNAVGGARAAQIIPYRHVTEPVPAPAGEAFTHIPNSGLQLPDGDTVVSTFAVRDWATDPATTTWSTNFAALWVSHDPDAEWYQPSPIITFPSAHPWYRFFQNQSMILWGNHVHVFGTPAGRSNDGGIYLMRHHWAGLAVENGWEFWGYTGGAWRWGRQSPTPILLAADNSVPGNKIGELNAQIVQGRIVLMYTDYSIGSTVSRIASAPDAPWTPAQPQVSLVVAPLHYAPGIHPLSTLADVHFGLSQWIAPGLTPPTGFVMYGVRQWHASVVGPIAPFARYASLADSGVAQAVARLSGDPGSPPAGPGGDELAGVKEADRASVLADLACGEAGADEMTECLALVRAGEASPPKPGQVRPADRRRRGGARP